MATPQIAVIDIGKTHAKVVLVDPASGDICWHTERANTSIQGPLVQELDVRGVERWLLASLRSAASRAEIGWVVPIAHGAAAVLVNERGEVLAAPDYEDQAFERIRDEYAPLRDAFDITLSPLLPFGLNLGRQLHLLETRGPQMFGAARHILLYPQYWSWRLSGVAAAEVTSLGCHTDLWCPREKSYSPLAKGRGWIARMPPIRRASELLGLLRPDVIAATGLPETARVLCGIHDSNATYLSHLATRTGNKPFAVVSSGTWTVVMARGTDLACLRESRAMLANVDAFGVPVATARFMGGREYAVLTKGLPDTTSADVSDIQRVLDVRTFAIPGFASAGGPFAAHHGALINARFQQPRDLRALAALYCALMTDLLLDWLGASGDVIIDGPFGDKALYCAILAALRPESHVVRSAGRAGAAHAALLLAGVPAFRHASGDEVVAADVSGLMEYRTSWRAQLPATTSSL